MRRLVLAAVLLTSCSTRSQPGPAPSPPAPIASTTPGSFFRAGALTFVAGTLGDDDDDRAIAGQIELVRGVIGPGTQRVDDTEVVAQNQWPAHPVVYGGPHVNAALAALKLPFTLTAGSLTIGGETFSGIGYGLITVVPADAQHPELLVFAGTGTPGIEEINDGSLLRGDAPITVIDAFGTLVSGQWTRAADGSVVAGLGPHQRRVTWRTATDRVGGVAVTYHVWDGTPESGDEAIEKRVARGIQRTVDKLELTRPTPLTVYVHPDKRSKASLTGVAGDGHAVPLAHALHVYDFPGVEDLVAHEATHVITRRTWGPPGSALLGEGLAVWVAGQYGGTALADFSRALAGVPVPPLVELLGPAFRRLHEGIAYPLGALAVDVAVHRVGLAAVREHLFGATASTWEDACRRAGTTAAELQAAFTEAVARPVPR